MKRKVRNYQNVIGGSASILNCGGLFLSGEWFHNIFQENGDPLSDVAPHLSQLLSKVEIAMEARGVNVQNNMHIAGYLAQSRLFANIDVRRYVVRFDECLDMVEVVKAYADAMRDLLSQSLAVAAVNELLRGCRHELDTVPGLYAIFQVVSATRL